MESGNVISSKNGNGNLAKFYSPLVLSIARKENIGQQELDAISGSGKEGRVTKRDILSYLDNRGSGTAIPASNVSVKSNGVAADSSSKISSGFAPSFGNGNRRAKK